MTWRVLILRTMLFLVIGALLTCVVAWSLSWRVLMPTDPRVHIYRAYVESPMEQKARWRINDIQRTGVRRYWVAVFRGADADRLMELYERYASNPNPLPGWAQSAVEGRLAQGVPSNELVIDSRGWPLPALVAVASVKENRVSGGFRLTRGPGPGFDWSIDPFAIPLTPLWSGFAVDTTLFAMLTWLGWLATGLSRRCIRRKRGRCPLCSYDLRHDFSKGCSECGWQRDKTVA